MDYATQPWTSAEKAQYQAARDVLYTADAAGRPAPSDKLLLYEEMKSAYQDLEEWRQPAPDCSGTGRLDGARPQAR